MAAKKTSVNKPKLEAYGIKGVKRTPWRKTFRDEPHLTKWAEDNDAEVFGTREAD